MDLPFKKALPLTLQSFAFLKGNKKANAIFLPLQRQT